MQTKLSVLFAAVWTLAGVAQAATVDWRQGSGNVGTDFTVASGQTSFANGGQGTLTLGLRAIHRGVGPVSPTGSVYAVELGESSPSRAWWNFDIYAGLTGLQSDLGFDPADVVTLSGLQSLTLQISTIGGSSPAAGSFNLLDATLRGAIDCHVSGCVKGWEFNADAGLSNSDPNLQNAKQYYNASQNPVFAPWFTGFDYLRSGIYDFTLTAIDQTGAELSTSMRVNAGNYVPEPGSFALAGLALAALAGARRR